MISESSGYTHILPQDAAGTTYQFNASSGGFFNSIYNGSTLVNNAASGFYCIDNTDRYATLQNCTRTVEVQGTGLNRVHSVIKVKGDYLVNGTGPKIASATVYYHFYYGRPEVRIEHKFIVTEHTDTIVTNDHGLSSPRPTNPSGHPVVWFKEIGLKIPLTIAGTVEARFGKDRFGQTQYHTEALPAGTSVWMVQNTFPHFGQSASSFDIKKLVGSTTTPLLSGAACNEWVDVGSSAFGLSAEVAGFVETFPKAFVAKNNELTIKLWASESGQQLDFRTSSLINNYFGTDWINVNNPAPDDPTELQEAVNAKNSAQGTARTHDLVLYPRNVAFNAATPNKFYAQREQVLAMPDPAHVASTKVMGLWRQKDTTNFPRAENVIEDFFQRAVFINQTVFPPNGYLGYGSYTYGSQPWTLRVPTGVGGSPPARWYPTVHRIARGLEYNLKRAVWVQAARSADPKYWYYAQRNARFFHDMIFMNAPCNQIPYQTVGTITFPASWNSPFYWGNAGYLWWASSEDVIQFDYDWFLCNDYHSRDMAKAYGDAIKAVQTLPYNHGTPAYNIPYAFGAPLVLRMIGSAFELTRDAFFDSHGNTMLAAMTTGDPDLPVRYKGTATDAALNYGKLGEMFQPFYYYWISNGNTKARDIMIKFADFQYHFGRITNIISRERKANPAAFAIAYHNNPGAGALYKKYCTEWAMRTPNFIEILTDNGISYSSYTHTTQADWNNDTIDEQDSITVGLPVAMGVAYPDQATTPSVPFVDKPYSTYRTFAAINRTSTAAGYIEFYVNNDSDAGWAPSSVKLYDPTGTLVATTIATTPAPRLKKIMEPQLSLNAIPWYIAPYNTTNPAGADSAYTIWVTHFDALHFFRVNVPTSSVTGTYRLEVGDEVAYKILDASSNLEKMMQVGPNGVMLYNSSAYYFKLPTGVTTVRLKANKPGFKIFKPNSVDPATGYTQVTVTALTPLGEGKYTFPTSGTVGNTYTWKIEPTGDDYDDPYTPSDLHLLFQPSDPGAIKVVTAVAQGAASRAFVPGFASTLTDPVDRTGWPVLWPRPLPANAFYTGKFGNGVGFLLRYLELAGLPAGGPYNEGTVEFWMKPLWSPMDVHVQHPVSAPPSSFGSIALGLFALRPVQLNYRFDHDKGSNRYWESKLISSMSWPGAPVSSVTDKPRAREYFQAGKWYHLAYCWKFDPTNSKSRFSWYVNGKRKAYFTEDNGIPKNLPVSVLGAGTAGTTMLFGSAGSTHAPFPTGVPNQAGGEVYDELRVSKIARYLDGTGEPPDTITVPVAAFPNNDVNNFILMHFDGNYDALVNNNQTPVTNATTTDTVSPYGGMPFP